MIKRFLDLCLKRFQYWKAMNNLAKLEWSTDYIIYLLKKSQIQGITMRIHEPGGRILEITVDTPNSPGGDFTRLERSLSQDEWDAILGIRGDL